MAQTTFTEAEINQRHRERVATLIDLYGDTFAIPRDVMSRLHSKNREDWQQHVEERDGKRKAQNWRLPITEPTKDQMAAVTPAAPAEPTDEPDEQAIVEDAEQILAEEEVSA